MIREYMHLDNKFDFTPMMMSFNDPESDIFDDGNDNLDIEEDDELGNEENEIDYGRPMTDFISENGYSDKVIPGNPFQRIEDTKNTMDKVNRDLMDL